MSVCFLAVYTLGARGEVSPWRKFMSPRKASLFSGLVPRPGSKTYLQGGAVKEKTGGVIVELKTGEDSRNSWLGSSRDDRNSAW